MCETKLLQIGFNVHKAIAYFIFWFCVALLTHLENLVLGRPLLTQKLNDQTKDKM